MAAQDYSSLSDDPTDGVPLNGGMAVSKTCLHSDQRICWDVCLSAHHVRDAMTCH